MTKLKVLLIILDGFSNASLESLRDVVPRGSQLSILNLSKIPSASKSLHDVLDSTFIDEVNLSLQLDEIISTYGHHLSGCLHDIYRVSADLWSARFTELNFSDPVWKAYVISRAIQRHAEGQDRPYERFVFLGKPCLLEAASREITTAEIVSIGHPSWPSSILQLYDNFYCYFTWLRNFLNELLAICMLRFQSIKYLGNHRSDHKIVIYGNYPSNWILNDIPRYRFTGRMTDDAEIAANVHFLVSAIHSNSRVVSPLRLFIRALKQLCCSDNVSILQSYSQFTDVFQSYLGSFDNVKWKSVFNHFSHVGLTFAYRNIRNNFQSIDNPKQLSLYRSMGRYLDANPNISRLLVPIFELVEARAVVLAARERGIEVIGMQHGLSGPWTNWRLISASGALRHCNSCAVPNQIYVEGILYKIAFEEYGFSNVHLIGAPRIRQLPIAPISHKPLKTISIIVLLDLHNWMFLIDWALKFASSCNNLHIILRAHPKTTTLVSDYLQRTISYTSNVLLDETPMNTCLASFSPHAVIATSTGALVEFALSGWPCFLVDDPVSPTNSPLYWQNSDILVFGKQFLCFNDLITFLNSNSLSAYCKKLKASAQNHIYAYSDNADQRLARSLCYIEDLCD